MFKFMLFEKFIKLYICICFDMKHHGRGERCDFNQLDEVFNQILVIYDKYISLVNAWNVEVESSCSYIKRSWRVNK